MRERYGVGQRNWWTIGAIVVVTLFFLAAVGWVTVAISSDRVQSLLLGWELQADDHIEITFEVRPTSGTEVYCVVRAQDSTRTDVGYATVVLPVTADYLRTTYPLATLIPAFTAELLGCAIDEPPAVIPPQFPPGVVPPDQPWQPEQLPSSDDE
jgi:hypothetical protein